MRVHVRRFLLFVPILICSCSGDDHTIGPKNSNPIFFNFNLKGSSYRVSDVDFTLRGAGEEMACSNDWVSGSVKLILEAPTQENFIESVEFFLTKKVFKDELDPANETSYVDKVVRASTFGFPVHENGFYKVYDLENSVFTVGRDISAEAFLYIQTKDQYYRSSSVFPVQRIDDSFVTIDNVVVNDGEDKTLYPYIVEGTFKVNLFVGLYGTTSELVEGNFRWPVANIQDSELLDLCD